MKIPHQQFYGCKRVWKCKNMQFPACKTTLIKKKKKTLMTNIKNALTKVNHLRISGIFPRSIAQLHRF